MFQSFVARAENKTIDTVYVLMGMTSRDQPRVQLGFRRLGVGPFC
jgi:hypothetical protein